MIGLLEPLFYDRPNAPIAPPRYPPGLAEESPAKISPTATAVHSTASLLEEAAWRHRSFAHRTMSRPCLICGRMDAVPG
jgi:hypothetical protein